ncbi:MAG TPA: hypothetical protein VIM12_11825 [Noviherbaspirillum sp.]|jgi:hypothetical protein|uniref:hypothetical protein n=1 Tax=Noviherbaspirillum sp. TaxID=1926288 RepID=UPI002F94CCC7
MKPLTRMYPRLACAALLALAGTAHAQMLAAPEPLGRGASAPAQAMDAQEAPMMAVQEVDGNFRQWYAKQGKPAVVLFFDRQLEQMPPGWYGATRLQIDSVSRSGNKEETHSVSIGMQRNTQRQAAAKSEFARLFEQSLSLELKRQNVRVLDGAYLHRKMAANKPKQTTDIEYDSISRDARFVFEVELIAIDGDGCEMVAVMKDVRTGDIAASVRYKAESLNSAAEIDRANRALVQRLMQYKVI